MSRKAMFDFFCEGCGETHERFVYPELEESLCGCGKMAKKALSAPSMLKIDGFRSDLMSDKWAKTRVKRNKWLTENEG